MSRIAERAATRLRRPAVAYANNNRIVKRRVSDLTYVAEYGTEGTGNDQLVGPLALTTDGTCCRPPQQPDREAMNRGAVT